MVTFPNPINLLSIIRDTKSASNVATLDASGESCTIIGNITIVGGGSKALSSSGGAIILSASTATFANAGTTLRVGIQDVNTSTGIEDGTFDVYADLVGGTDTIASNTTKKVPIETGSRTYNDGELIAISVEMISRGGADSVQISGTPGLITTSSLFPYMTIDTGSGPAKNGFSQSILYGIEFDDGTLGWVNDGPILPFPLTVSSTVATFGSTSTPDEYANVFEYPISLDIIGGGVMAGSITSTDTFEIVLYSDPTGTPTIMETITINPVLVASNNANFIHLFRFSNIHTLTADTLYAIAVRPTSANTISFAAKDFTTTFQNWKAIHPFGATCQVMTRTNQSGAFTLLDDKWLPIFSLTIVGMETPSTGGGGEQVITFG